MKLREAKVSTMTAVDATLGAVSLISIHAVGSAAASTVTIQDGTAIKFAPIVGITAVYDKDLSSPVAFANLVIDLTGTGSYSLTYLPRP